MPEIAGATPQVISDLTGTWTLDPRRSTIQFQTKAMWILTVNGTLRVTEGGGTADRDGRVTGCLVVDANSIDTKNKRRDGHLRTGDRSERVGSALGQNGRRAQQPDYPQGDLRSPPLKGRAAATWGTVHVGAAPHGAGATELACDWHTVKDTVTTERGDREPQHLSALHQRQTMAETGSCAVCAIVER